MVFHPRLPADAGPQRQGTIVVGDLETAHHEARQIAHTGGIAEVRYVSDSGDHHVLAV